jgi:hypothetical protein
MFKTCLQSRFSGLFCHAMPFDTHPLSHDKASEYGRRGVEKREENRSKLPVDPHQRRDLLRVREQIGIACKAFKAVKEPSDIYRLSCSLSKLREDERKLAGRPDPGSYRPTAPKEKKPKEIEPGEA